MAPIALFLAAAVGAGTAAAEILIHLVGLWQRRLRPRRASRFVCHIQPLPPVPVYQLRILREGQEFGESYPAVATLLQHPDRFEIIGLHASETWTTAHHRAVLAALWRHGMRGMVVWDRMKRVAGRWRKVPVRAPIHDPALGRGSS